MSSYDARVILARERRAIEPGSVISHRLFAEPSTFTLAARAAMKQVRDLVRLESASRGAS